MPPWSAMLHQARGVVSEWMLEPVKRAAEASDPPVTQPTPASNNTSNLPRIGGSFGGFIALVVSLAAIVVFSCIAIFILLYKYKPDPYERHYRQTMFGKREASIYETPLGPQGMRAKFKNLIGRGRKSEGWMRTGDGSEEWDASDRHILPGSYGRDSGDSDAPPMDSPFKPPPRAHQPSIRRSDTSESIELSVPNASHTRDRDDVIVPTSTYSDPFTTSHSPPSGEPVNTMAFPTSQEDADHFSVQSPGDGALRSMRKFSGGTKFKEAIDFS
ncbi:hypothetical protein BXZ70DRAFT_180623 [Cristinia sonorae]|uniref:Uncharacterized protein n=1 Tax=Cristinia sonorae TaxID=1940300 RepID=A0A8K0XQ42_9AGAR|nr:hypothetical protein BXZ70DRAFT_180623 [Cristinia sonorae]